MAAEIASTDIATAYTTAITACGLYISAIDEAFAPIVAVIGALPAPASAARSVLVMQQGQLSKALATVTPTPAVLPPATPSAAATPGSET